MRFTGWLTPTEVAELTGAPDDQTARNTIGAALNRALVKRGLAERRRSEAAGLEGLAVTMFEYRLTAAGIAEADRMRAS
jgi:hypothetical protein